jgi:hypothetical protein
MESPLENSEGASCPFCGERNEKESRFCIHCGECVPEDSKKRFKKRFKKRYILFGGLGLFLAVSVLFFGRGVFGSKVIGKVNGEVIARKEFLKRVDRMKKLYENRYGESLFRNEDGTQNLNRLKAQILDEMVTEKVLLQEAKNAGYTSAPPEEIEKELEAMKKRNGLSAADLEKMIGGKIEDLKAELGKEWVISEFVGKAVLKDNPQNGRLVFGQWLAKAKAAARIETYEKPEPVSTAKATCCTNGCGGSGQAQPLDPKIEKEAKAKGLEYYEKKTQKKGANAKVANFGCHIQVDIIEDGRVVISLTYREGEVQEI